MENETNEGIAQPAPIPGQVGASPPPLGLVIIMNVSIFMVICWGMMILFGRRPWDGTQRQAVPRPEPRPGQED